MLWRAARAEGSRKETFAAVRVGGEQRVSGSRPSHRPPSHRPPLHPNASPLESPQDPSIVMQTPVARITDYEAAGALSQTWDLLGEI